MVNSLSATEPSLQTTNVKHDAIVEHMFKHILRLSILYIIYSDAQWPWEKRASFCGWLTFKGNPYQKKKKRQQLLGNWVYIRELCLYR